MKEKTYKIGQAAKLLDVKPFVLRFWESEFGHVLVPVRTPAGQRAYTEDNIALVREIKRLLYDEGLTIEGAKKRLGQPHEPAASPSPASAPAPAPPVATAAPDAPRDTRTDILNAALRDALLEVRSELTAIRKLLD